MRALLINPWIYDFAAYDLWSKPLGLLKIAAALNKVGVEVDLIDCQDRFHPRLKRFPGVKIPGNSKFGCGHYYSEAIETPAILKPYRRRFKRYGLPVELFRELIKETPKPDIILVTSGMTYWYPAVFDAIKILRDHFGGVPIMLGGIYARICFSHAREKSGSDVVYGGGDITEIIKLTGRLTGIKLDPSAVDNNRPIFPQYGLYPQLPYVTLRTSNGCPFKCSYCAWHLLEKKFSQEGPGYVLGKIEYFYRGRGVKNFAFYDEALLYNAEGHIVKILEGVLKRKIDANFHTPNGLHVKFITPGLAVLMKKAGFIQPRLGLETVSGERQRQSGGKATTEEFIRAVDFLKAAGYRSSQIGVNILIGLPGQSLDEIRGSIEFIASKKMRIFLEEYSPIPDTPEYEKTKLAPDADPLLHNNSLFSLYPQDKRLKVQELKDLAHRLNNNLKN